MDARIGWWSIPNAGIMSRAAGPDAGARDEKQGMIRHGEVLNQAY